MPETPEPEDGITPDEVLLESTGLALDALREIAPEHSIGSLSGHFVEGDRTLSLWFECRLPGYPGWHWTVTLSRVGDGSAPTVLEAELMPGEGAVLAPDWIPWSERLADYRATQEAQRAAREADEGDADDDDADDDADDDELDSGFDDIDGVDVDAALEDEELAALDREVDDSDDPEGQSDDGDPEPPAESAGEERAAEHQQGDEGDNPSD